MSTPRTKRWVRRSRGRSRQQLHDPAGIDREQRQDRAELDEHLERLARALEAENAAGEQKMRRRGDRQELGHAFDDAENQGVDDVVQLHWLPRSDRHAAGEAHPERPFAAARELSLFPPRAGFYTRCAALARFSSAQRRRPPESSR